ncbi:hypothetical protein H5410_062682 [Solanum commersonii]|uniref:Uncharacterized protein n=1 Tax=Solanum commersonii TaxID=4109 RepID=A0A9J5WC82_SOLCO|nr:hypothetical protein H5410_062682 [Solanum commersonii]
MNIQKSSDQHPKIRRKSKNQSRTTQKKGEQKSQHTSNSRQVFLYFLRIISVDLKTHLRQPFYLPVVWIKKFRLDNKL